MAWIFQWYQTRFTNAKTSWKRESVWEYEVMFEGGLKDEMNWRSREQPKLLPSRCGFGSGNGSGRTPLPIVWQRYGSGLIPVCTAAWPLWSWQRYRQWSWWILVTWRMDHGFLSDQILHGLGSGWSTATWIVVNHMHALNQEIFMEEEIGCFLKFE